MRKIKYPMNALANNNMGVGDIPGEAKGKRVKAAPISGKAGIDKTAVIGDAKARESNPDKKGKIDKRVEMEATTARQNRKSKVTPRPSAIDRLKIIGVAR